MGTLGWCKNNPEGHHQSEEQFCWIGSAWQPVMHYLTLVKMLGWYIMLNLCMYARQGYWYQ